MKLYFVRIAIATFAFAIPVTGVMAGAKSTNSNVIIVDDSSGHYASGSLGVVRSSGDTVQEIGCVVEATRGTSAGVAGLLSTYCYATAANGTFRSCSSSDPEVAAGALAVKGDSFLEFHWASPSDDCVRIIANNDSTFRPKR